MQKGNNLSCPDANEARSHSAHVPACAKYKTDPLCCDGEGYSTLKTRVDGEEEEEEEEEAVKATGLTTTASDGAVFVGGWRPAVKSDYLGPLCK